MPMEAAAMDKLVEKGRFRPDVAQAIAEAIDITIQAANLVTVPMFEARFAASELKMEARFGSIESSIESTKARVTYLYAGLVIALFSAIAVDHHWLVTREDQLIAQIEARSDQRFGQIQARFDQIEARSDQRFGQIQARFDQIEARSDQRFEQIQARFDQLQARFDQRFDQLRTRHDESLDQLRGSQREDQIRSRRGSHQENSSRKHQSAR